MLSMINPDSLTRIDNNKFGSNSQVGQYTMNPKNSHDHFYHEELEDHVPSGLPPTKPGTAAGKTFNNFY